jgi:hypothetical protein
VKRAIELEQNLELAKGCLLILAAILWLALSGCADAKVDAEVKPYVDRFEQAAIEYGVDVKIEFDVVLVPDEELAGLKGKCEKGLGKGVKLRRSYWNKVGDKEKESLVAHELGHCALGLEHGNGVMAEEYSIYGWSYEELFNAIE